MATMKDPADILIQEAIEDHLDALIQAISGRVEALISEQLGKVSSEGLTVSEAMAKYPEIMDRYEQLLADGRLTASATVQQVFNEMATLNDEWASRYYEAMGRAQTAAASHEVMGGILADAVVRSSEVINGTLNSSVIGIIASDKRFIGFGDYYRQSVSEAVAGMLAGKESYEAAVKKSVEQMARSGLRTVTTPTGRTVKVIGAKAEKITSSGEYITRELYGTIRTEVMDNYRQTLSAMRQVQGREFGANGVEISAHAPCAPDHVRWQGQQLSNAEFKEINDSLPRPYEAWNCKHVVSPIILGLSRPAYMKDELDEMKRSSEELVTVTGLGGGELTRTRYEMTQYQREIERSLRREKNLSYQLKTAEQDTKSLDAAIRQRQAEYRRITAEAGLTTRNERTRAYIAK